MKPGWKYSTASQKQQDQMNNVKTSVKLAVASGLAAVPMGLSACATAHEAPSAVEAILLNPQDAASRNAIRIFVREKSGSQVITNPDSLSQTPILINHQRQTNLGRRNLGQALKPTGDYRLVMDENKRCWLIHRLQDTVSHLELPSSASCAPYRAL